MPHSILITGNQGTGKSALAQLISQQYPTLFIEHESSLRSCLPNTKCIVIEGISTPFEMAVFKRLSTLESFTARLPYCAEQHIVYPELIIGICQSKPDTSVLGLRRTFVIEMDSNNFR